MDDETLWVFAYGSLLWNPGFTAVEAITARLDGYRRSFCMLSVHYRGTEDAPGLVLALDAADGADERPNGAFCTGVALRVPDAERDAVLAYLRKRELISSAYVERVVTVTLNDGRCVTALTYVVGRDHEQYCALSPDEQARLIAGAVGERGPNFEYLYNTAAHLRTLEITDPDLDALEEQVRTIRSKA